MTNYKLIATDLDGTLFNDDKLISQGNRQAFAYAKSKGVKIVPATGRLFKAISDEVLSLDIDYIISINGAKVITADNSQTIFEAIIPTNQAVEIMKYLDTFDCIYDCFMNDSAYMNRRFLDRAQEFALDDMMYKMIRRVRQPVDELKEFIAQPENKIYKMQFFFKGLENQKKHIEDIEKRFTDVIATASSPVNIEINNTHANKGEAMEKLCNYLNIDISESMAFGDGLNDMSLIQKAGMGIAMKNAHPDILAIAKDITDDNNTDGIASSIYKYIG